MDTTLRRPIIAGNWKMNKTSVQAVELVRGLTVAAEEAAHVEVAVFPPATALKSVSTTLEYDKIEITLGAQNMHWKDEGAYTGEVSAAMLLDLLVKAVLVGHSERRTLFHETDDEVNLKVTTAHAKGLTPFMCVGETLEEHEADQAKGVVRRQVLAGLAGLTEKQVVGAVICYEPVWAIGTGKVATAEEAGKMANHIRTLVTETWGTEAAGRVRILYGGSVDPGNTGLIVEKPDIDGVLVGGASLTADKFGEIIKAAESKAKAPGV